MRDVLVGLADVLAEGCWRATQSGAALGLRGWSLLTTVATGVTPDFARRRYEVVLVQLAERGRRARQERGDAMASAVTVAITTAATSDAVRELTLVTVAEASDELLDVMMPSVLDAMATTQTQAKLDELIAGLLLRQLPSALEKTLPQVLLRTATKPALGVVPFLGGMTSRL